MYQNLEVKRLIQIAGQAKHSHGKSKTELSPSSLIDTKIGNDLKK